MILVTSGRSVAAHAKLSADPDKVAELAKQKLTEGGW